MQFILTALLFSFSFNFSYASEFKIPRLSGPVVDQAKILSPSFKRQLTQSLFNLQKINKTDPLEIAVLTVPSLGGLPLEQASIKVVDKWKLGSTKGDRGILILISKKERKIRIEVGQGLEGSVTDAFSMQVIDNMVPLFRSGRVDEGVLLGVFSIAQKAVPEKDISPLFRGKANSNWNRKKKRRSGFSFIPILIFGLIFIFGGRRGRSGLVAGMLLGSMSGGRSYGGGFGSSGGGSFGGGGGFSGGGASGGW